MKTLSAGIKLAVFAAVTILATGVLAGTIGAFGFGDTVSYRALFTDATGLQPGDDVRIAGVKVGEVQDVSVARGTLAEVAFSVRKDRPLARSTRAVIRYRNLVGQRYVALAEGAGDDSPLRPGATIPLAQTAPALDLTVLFNGFKPLFAALTPHDVNQLSYEIIKVLQGEGGSVESLLAHTASLTSTLADRDAVIGRTVDNLNSVLGTLDQRDQKVSDLIVQLQRFVSGLSQDREAIGSSLQSISGLADATSGLLHDARPALKTDIAQLGRVAGTLDDNQKTIDAFLGRLPGKLERITRTATYGSWFNFYLCDFDGRIVLPLGQTAVPDYAVSSGRCR